MVTLPVACTEFSVGVISRSLQKSSDTFPFPSGCIRSLSLNHSPKNTTKPTNSKNISPSHISRFDPYFSIIHPKTRQNPSNPKNISRPRYLFLSILPDFTLAAASQSFSIFSFPVSWASPKSSLRFHRLSLSHSAPRSSHTYLSWFSSPVSSSTVVLGCGTFAVLRSMKDLPSLVPGCCSTVVVRSFVVLVLMYLTLVESNNIHRFRYAGLFATPY